MGARNPKPWPIVCPAHVEMELPIRVLNPTNEREHWRVKHKRNKGERQAVALRWASEGRWIAWQTPVKVMLVRIIGPRGRVMDDDGCIASFKAIRDEVAKQLGIDDGDPRISFTYSQERGTSYAVRIEVRERP